MCEGQKSGAYNNRSISMGKSGDPYGIRTRVAGVKGQCPRPLDEGVAKKMFEFFTKGLQIKQ